LHVVITGASRGLGRFLARGLGPKSEKLHLIYHEDDEKMRETVEGISAPYDVFKCDISQEPEVAHVFQQIPEIDVLINNAGFNEDALLENMGIDSWKKVIDVNLTGAFLCSKYAVPKMTKFGSQIINISSVVAQTGSVGAVNYAASKAGLEGLTRSLGRELIRKGIFVNAIALGFFDVGMGTRLPMKIKEKVLAQILLKEFGDPVELLKLIEYLIGQRYMVGQVICLNGGYRI